MKTIMGSPTLNSVAGVAKLIDHAILHPSLGPSEMRADLESVLAYPLASACIKPHAVALAAEVLAGSVIKTCTVISFPHGNSRPDAKAFETERAIADGATEIDMVVNQGLVRDEDWNGVRHDIASVLTVCRAHGALLKVIFENDYLGSDALKTELCHVCADLRVDFVKTSTGFGFLRDADGKFSTRGASIADLRLMRANSPEHIGVKASGGVRNLDDLIHCAEAGANRIGTTSTHAILREATARFGA